MNYMRNYFLVICAIGFLVLGGDGVTLWNQGAVAEAAAPSAQETNPKGLWVRILKNKFQLHLASEGCIRMHNGDLEALKKRIKPGTAVVIEP